ncbi:MAG: prepilin-type N-terminal cleavage/methylation domain-containing protein [Pseudomonadota bacterium]|nr:prepilin-type N-terminal cleavage/methylation domain-containing protein [Pseudomonadota bacterium]
MMRIPACAARRQRGITLLELLLALSAGALLLSAVMPMLNVSISAAASAATTEQTDLERQAAFAIDRIGRALRAAAPTVLAAPPGLTGLLAILNPATQDTTTSGTWFAPATFQLSGTAAPFTLVEKRDGDAVLHVLAVSVDSFSIVPLPVSDGRQLVKIDLVLKKNNLTTSASSVVRMGWLQ